MKKKILIILSGIVGVILISIMGMLLYTKVYLTPKNIYMKALDKGINKVDNLFNHHYNNESGVISFDASVSGYNDIYANIINKLDFNISYNIDYKNSKFDADLDINYANQDLITANIYASDKKIYLKDNTLYNNYIKTDYDYTELLNGNNDNIKYTMKIIKEIKKAIQVSLEDKYFDNDIEFISIDNKSVKVTKNQLSLTYDEYVNVENNIYKYLSNSKTYIKNMAKLTNKKGDEIKSSLKRKINEKTNKASEREFITINLYTKGLTNKFVKLDIHADNQVISFIKLSDETYSLSINTGTQIINTNIKLVNNNDMKNIIIDCTENEKSINVKIAYSINHNNEFNNKEIKDYIDYSKLTENDNRNIRNNLINKPAYKELEQDISNIFGGLYGYNTFQ